MVFSNSMRSLFLALFTFSISSNRLSTLARCSFTLAPSSSISRLLPRRLLLFLKAPPLIAPPGTKSSPSNVTIRIPYPNFLAIFTALSTWSTTIILPSMAFATFLYFPSTLTSRSAIPMAPFSFKASGFLNS